MLSDDQARALDATLLGHNVFITGPGGTGKSHLVDEIVGEVEQMGKAVRVCASTGLAALNVGGSTIHKLLGTGMAQRISEAEPWLNRMNSGMRNTFERRLSSFDVLIIDEVSMLSGDYIGMASAWLKIMRKDERPFGGVQVIFVGDFMQLPPVDKKRKNVSPFAFMGNGWENADVLMCELTTPHRQADPEFVATLNRLRFGHVDAAAIELFAPCVDRMLENPTKLLSTNDAVNAVNARELMALPGESTLFEATTGSRLGMAKDKAWTAINHLLESCLSPKELELKVGAPVLMTANDPEDRFVNGSRGVILELHDSVSPWAKVEIGGVQHDVGRHKWEAIGGNGKMDAWMRQLPMRLAWALTIHKAQGMTLDPCFADLRNVFAPGMAYVALSRAARLEGLELASALRVEQVFANLRLVEFYSPGRSTQHD